MGGSSGIIKTNCLRLTLTILKSIIVTQTNKKNEQRKVDTKFSDVVCLYLYIQKFRGSNFPPEWWSFRLSAFGPHQSAVITCTICMEAKHKAPSTRCVAMRCGDDGEEVRLRGDLRQVCHGFLITPTQCFLASQYKFLL